MTLVCAATRTEADACRAGIADSGVAGVEVLLTGVGPDRAAAALRARLAAGPRPRLVVSAGFAGALGGGLEPLAWVSASSLYRLDGGRAVELPLAPGLLRVAGGAVACAVVTADGVASAPVQGLPSPAAVDMESTALAVVARDAGIPVVVLRLVTDTPARPLPPVARSLASALASARASDGLRAALDAARDPRTALRLVRDGLRWRDALRAGWRERARDVAGG